MEGFGGRKVKHLTYVSKIHSYCHDDNDWGKSGMKVISLQILTIIQAMDNDNLVATIKVVRTLSYTK